MVVIGWDVSTAAIGICVKVPDSPHEFSLILPKGETALEKWRDAVRQVRDFMGTRHYVDPVHHVVEQRLGGFTGGLTTKQTLMALAAMNAVVSLELSQSGEVTHILPITAKSIMKIGKLQLEGEDKKEAVVRLARSSCPGFPYMEKKSSGKPTKGKTYPWVNGTDDMADAWLLVEAYHAMREKAESGQQEKAAGRKGEARGAKAKRPKEGRVRVSVPEPEVHEREAG